MKILLIEDNKILSRNTVRYFALKKIQTDVSFDWQDWLNKAKTNYYDAIILDISLPEMNWFEICKNLRIAEKTVPIIMLTSRNTKKDIIEGLNAWADDYLTKPFDYEELLARINSLTRRHLKNKSDFIKIWKFDLDLEKNEVSENNEIIKLSALEFRLLKYLSQNKKKAISRKELYEKVWGEFDWNIMFSKTVEVYIWYLRKKLDRNLIETVKWVWYIIK